MSQKINPDSTILQQTDGHWQKLAAFIIWKLAGAAPVRITAADMESMAAAFAPGIPVILTHGHSDSIEFSIVTEEAAQRLAAHDKNMRGGA